MEGQSLQTLQQAQRSRPSLSERHGSSALVRQHAAQAELAGRLAQRSR
ncbi:hypothetical protein [Reticulibacter mediterranei]|nr:hypothetical protein [Reticulibacter mediterranei]